MNRKNFHIIEASCIACSLIGSVISAVTGQIVYASAPLALALSMNFINRVKLQQQTLTQTTKATVPIEKLEKLEGSLVEISRSVEKTLNVLPGFKELDNKIITIQSYLDLIVRDQLSGFDNNVLVVNKKLESQRKKLDKLFEYIDSYESRIYKLEDENKENIYDSVITEIKQTNQLLSQIQPYEYLLVCDRVDSRKYLVEAIKESKQRLILVCPWLTKAGFYDSNGSNIDLIEHLERALKRGVIVDIGWGYLNDIPSNYQNTKMTRQKFLQVINKNNTPAWKYEALEALENIQYRYPNKLNLKLIGTHEKFITCDESFGIIGSHNFLTSGSTSKERELGIRTNDPNIIKQLIERFDNAKSLSDSIPESTYTEISYTVNELDCDDIPF